MNLYLNNPKLCPLQTSNIIPYPCKKAFFEIYIFSKDMFFRNAENIFHCKKINPYTLPIFDTMYQLQSIQFNFPFHKDVSYRKLKMFKCTIHMQINMSLKKTEFSMNYMVYGLEYIDILDNNIILFYMQINELYKDRIFNDLHVLLIGIHYKT